MPYFAVLFRLKATPESAHCGMISLISLPVRNVGDHLRDLFS